MAEVARTLPVEEVSKFETRAPLDLIRKDEATEIERLTKEIQKEGITEPITIRVREDGSQIVWDGLHRLIVAQDLGIKNIPIQYIGEVQRLPPAVEVPAVKGTCYEDAWRYLIKEEEGELIHGTVESLGRRIEHAWVELPTGYIWDPQTKSYFSIKDFNIAASPIEEHRYTVEEAAIMLSRVGKHGPWTKEEKEHFLRGNPEAVPEVTEQIAGKYYRFERRQTISIGEQQVRFYSKDRLYAEVYQGVMEERGWKGEIVEEEIELTNPLIVQATKRQFGDANFERQHIERAIKEGYGGVVFRSGEDEFIAKIVSPKPPAVEEVKKGSNPHLLPENVPEVDFTTVTDVGSIYDLFSEGKISLHELDRLKDHYYKWYYSPERRTTVLRFYRQPDGTMTIYKQVYVQTYGERGNPNTGTSIIDLRGDYDEMAHVKDGILYRRGNIIQVWWDKWGKETWTGPDEKDARQNFQAMKERWTEPERGNPEEVPTVPEVEPEVKTLAEMDATPEIHKLYPEFDEIYTRRNTLVDRLAQLEERARGRPSFEKQLDKLFEQREQADADLVAIQRKITKEHPELAYREAEPPAEDILDLTKGGMIEISLDANGKAIPTESEGGNPVPEELDLAGTLAIIDSRPKGRIIESKLREEFGDAVIDALRQGRYVVSGSAGYNPPLLVSLKGRELIQGGNPVKELITKEEAIGLLERLSMTPGEAARSLVADEAERREIMQTVQQRVKGEQKKWAPMDPREGPPLPRIFAGLRWPWKK